MRVGVRGAGEHGIESCRLSCLRSPLLGMVSVDGGGGDRGTSSSDSSHTACLDSKLARFCIALTGRDGEELMEPVDNTCHALRSFV